jgi:hypothetical protein
MMRFSRGFVNHGTRLLEAAGADFHGGGPVDTLRLSTDVQNNKKSMENNLLSLTFGVVIHLRVGEL